VKRPARASAAACALLLLFAGLGCGGPEAPATPPLPTRAELLAIVDEALGASDPTIRAEAARVLPLAGLPELDQRVLARLSDNDARVRAAAAEAGLRAGLSGAADALLQRLASGTPDERSEALALLVRLAPGAQVRRALDMLVLQSAALRAEAFERLRQRRLRWDAEVVSAEYLRRLVEDDRPFLPMVVEALVTTGHRDALNSVHADLMSAEREERLRALRILTAAPSPDAWPQLRWLHQRGSTEDHALAALALARLGDGSVHAQLFELVDARHSPQRLAAARALRYVALPEDRAALRRLAQNDSADIRRAALDALAALGLGTEDVLAFAAEPDVDVYAALVAHVLAAESTPGVLLCTQLRVVSDPTPLLRLISAALTARGSARGFDECPGILAELLGAREPATVGLAARLRYALIGVDEALAAAIPSAAVGASAVSGVFDLDEVLYAYLEASLAQEPGPFETLYLGSLHHELLPVRLLASLGLLASSRAAPR
jgi:HEAT repeat protein